MKSACSVIPVQTTSQRLPQIINKVPKSHHHKNQRVGPLTKCLSKLVKTVRHTLARQMSTRSCGVWGLGYPLSLGLNTLSTSNGVLPLIYLAHSEGFTIWSTPNVSGLRQGVPSCQPLITQLAVTGLFALILGSGF